VLAAHFEDLLAKPSFVIGAETGNIHGVVTHEGADLVANFDGIGELVLRRVGREETADADAFDGAQRVTRRQPHDDGALVVAREVIPDGRLGDGTGVHEAEAAIGAVGAIAKAVDAERAGVLAGGHAHPRGDGDRRDDALEASPRAHAHQAVKILEALVAEDDFRRGAVETQNADFRM
jgi:hypothetical protein